jgi:hypothetical protein
MINRQFYATSNPGNAPVVHLAADRRLWATGLAHARNADAPSSQDAVDPRRAGRGLESAKPCVRTTRASRDLAPRAGDLGPARAGGRGGCALPRTALAEPSATVAERAARGVIGPYPVDWSVGRAPKGSGAISPSVVSVGTIAGWRLPAFTSMSTISRDQARFPPRRKFNCARSFAVVRFEASMRELPLGGWGKT